MTAALGRGVHGAIPLHVVFEAKDVTVNGAAEIQAGADAEVSCGQDYKISGYKIYMLILKILLILSNDCEEFSWIRK